MLTRRNKNFDWRRVDVRSLDLKGMKVAIVGGTGGIGRAFSAGRSRGGSGVPELLNDRRNLISPERARLGNVLQPHRPYARRAGTRARGGSAHESKRRKQCKHRFLRCH